MPHGDAALLLDENPVGRALVLRQAREETLKKTRGHYPAPLAAIDAVAAGYAHGTERGLPRGVAAVRRDGDDRRVAAARLPLLRDDRAQEGPGRARQPAPPPAAGREARRSSAPDSWARASRRSPCSRARSSGSRTPITAASGRDLPRSATFCKERLTKKQITRAAVRRLRCRCSAARSTTPGFATSISSSRRCSRISTSSTRCCAKSEAVHAPDAIFASNTSTIPIAQIAAGVGAAGARARDAFLLAGAQDAAARGDRHRRRPIAT